MQRMVFANRPYAGELTRTRSSACAARCPRRGADLAGAPVAVGDACDVLARWDLRENLDSRGAVLFRRFWRPRRATSPTRRWRGRSTRATPSDAGRVRHHAARRDDRAGRRDRRPPAAGVALDARVGDVQGIAGGRRIPAHGGPGDPNGEFNMIESCSTAATASAPSWTALLRAGGDLGRRPRARIRQTILTYSQSANPRSPYSRPDRCSAARPGCASTSAARTCSPHGGHDGPRTPTAIVTIARRTAGAESARRAGSASRTPAT